MCLSGQLLDRSFVSDSNLFIECGWDVQDQYASIWRNVDGILNVFMWFWQKEKHRTHTTTIFLYTSRFARNKSEKVRQQLSKFLAGPPKDRRNKSYPNISYFNVKHVNSENQSWRTCLPGQVWTGLDSDLLTMFAILDPKPFILWNDDRTLYHCISMKQKAR